MASQLTPEEIQAVFNVLKEGLGWDLADRVRGELGEIAPVPQQGDLVRVGTQNPRNLYLHRGNDTVGKPMGMMLSPGLAEGVAKAMNQALQEQS